jgi:hypothetical protein
LSNTGSLCKTGAPQTKSECIIFSTKDFTNEFFLERISVKRFRDYELELETIKYVLVFHHIIRIDFSLKRFFKKLYPSQTQDHFKTGAQKKQVRVPSIIFETEEEPTRQPAIQFEHPTL